MDCTSVFQQDGTRTLNVQMNAERIKKLKEEWQAHMKEIMPCPDHFYGRGIVICAGGTGYFTCAWINISMLRQSGCHLPVEVWYTGNELNREVIAALEEMNVVCRNAGDHTDDPVNGLALKPFAICHSRFEEVLFLDADNNCVKDPSFLFEEDAYLKTGALFWPDFWLTGKDNPIWEITDSDDYDAFEQESGQILINKKKCWRALQLCLHFNRCRNDYYQLLLGDKDTFRFAWIASETPYFMVPSPVAFCGFNEPEVGFCGMTMVQHDLQDQILFLHRNWLKWDITRDDEFMWIEVKRFSTAAVHNRQFVIREISRDGLDLKFWDIEGAVESFSFHKLLGNYEQRCLKILQELRASELYARFLLHFHFVQYRPGYANGYIGNIFTAAANLPTL